MDVHTLGDSNRIMVGASDVGSVKTRFFRGKYLAAVRLVPSSGL